MNRVDLFYQVPQLADLQGLPEKLVEKEVELGESLGDTFTFSKKVYNNEADKKMILGRINSWYFLAVDQAIFNVFEDKRTFLLFIKREFDKANESREDELRLDPTWKAFWTREIETI